jgi:parallel beta-helix repeat protein
MKIKVLVLIIALVMVNVTSATNQESNTHDLELSNQRNLDKKLDVISHDAPITITDNSGFGIYNGSGTSEDPYVIENKDITSGANLIMINDTDAYFIIRNSTLTNGDHGIILNNVSNGNIYNNTIAFNKENGVTFIESNNTILNDNTIFNNGINCTPPFLTLDRITLDSHGGSGAWFDPSNNIVITNNLFYNNSRDGITIHDATGFIIQNNNITENGAGLCSPFLNQLHLDSSHLSEHYGLGINVHIGSDIRIEHNNIYENLLYGVNFDSTSSNNFVEYNNFVDNTNTPQATDMGELNRFYGNYWDDYTGSGSYLIAGNAQNEDPWPQCSENWAQGIRNTYNNGHNNGHNNVCEYRIRTGCQCIYLDSYPWCNILSKYS